MVCHAAGMAASRAAGAQPRPRLRQATASVAQDVRPSGILPGESIMMTEHWELVLCIAGSAFVTFVPRVGPIMFLNTEALPAGVRRWLSFVPVAVMAALLGPDVLVRDNVLYLSTDNLFLLVAIPALGVAWWTKSFFGTIAFGMGAVALARWWGIA